MIYLVDIGNSRLKYIVGNNPKNKEITSASITELNYAWFERHWGKAKKLIIASVNQAVLCEQITLWASQQQISVEIIQSSDSLHGVKSGYEKPSQLGVDRWLVLVASQSLFPNRNCLIVDAGTATTIDLISADGQHQGGWILPGFELMFNSVLNNTSKVKAELSKPNLTFGKNTSDNVNHACWAATIGLILQAQEQALLNGMQVEKTILTGGNADHISSLLRTPHIVVNDLVFIGLKKYS
ncbi:MAG: type III pantothenate kinase [Thalassotalea sp.]